MNLPSLIDLAKSYVGDSWEFWNIREVKWCADRDRGALWFPHHGSRTARIEVGWLESEDILWHEVFHSVWQDCPLNKLDPAWGEGFCNAFHQFNNFVSHHGPEFPNDWDFVTARLARDSWRRVYGIPEALLLKEFGRDRHRFRSAFKSLNALASSGEIGLLSFSHHLGYDPENGNRLEKIRIPGI